MKTKTEKTTKISNYIKERILYNKNFDKDTNNIKNNNVNSENMDKLNWTYNFDIKELDKNIKEINQNWDVNTPKRITSHRKLLGKFIVFGKKIVKKFLFWYVDPTIEQQKYFNASSTRSINEMYKLLTDIIPMINEMYNEVNNVKNNNSVLVERVEYLDSEIHQISSILNNKIDILEQKMSQMQQQIETDHSNTIDKEKTIYSYIESEINKVTNYIDQERYRLELDFKSIRNEINYSEKLNKYTQNFNLLINKLSQENALNTKIADLNNKVTKLEQTIQTNNNSLLIEYLKMQNGFIENQQKTDNSNISINYLDFENKFRGSEEDIKEKFKVYLKYIENKNKILDIGCGRGEMLELLKENNIEALGIDINDHMINHCKTKGLNVKKADALEYLTKTEDNTLEGVFMGQVVEHLDFNYLITLMNIIKQKLTPEGILIIESPNPLCLYIYSYGFFVDPSHSKPVHPYTMDYVLNDIGFKEVKLKLLSPVPEDSSLTYLNESSENDENINKLNENFKKINKLLFSYQDYAIIAKK